MSESSTATVNLSGNIDLTAHYVDGSQPALLLSELSADTTSTTAGSTVKFLTRSSGGTSPYSWSVDFGDGTASPFATDTTLEKQYNQAGTYKAVATAVDSTGRTAASSPVEIS